MIYENNYNYKEIILLIMQVRQIMSAFGVNFDEIHLRLENKLY